MAMTDMKGLPPPVEVYPEAGGPSLADLGQCAPHDREPLARFLLESSTLMAAPMRLPDPLDPDRGNVMSAHINTDGEWYWAMAWGYLVAEHGIGVPEEFLEHARNQGFRPSKLSAAELMALLDEQGSAKVPPHERTP